MADMDQELAKIDQNMECDSIAHWPSLLGFACTKHLLIFVLNHFYKKRTNKNVDPAPVKDLRKEFSLKVRCTLVD